MKQYFINSEKPPLVVESTGENISELMEHITTNNRYQKEILSKGAVLFRGFPIHTPAEFEKIAATIDADLKNDYLGTSPRNQVPGTNFVFTASELPPFYPIMQHCEMSFLQHPPRKLFFYCHVEPKLGGETPLCDFRKVYEQLDKKILSDFETKGVITVRNYSAINHKPFLNLFELKKWNEMFLTNDKKVVEQKCIENGIEYEWHSNDRLKLLNRTEAVKAHPITGEKAWFNHAQVFHLSASAYEYQHIHAYQKRLETFFYKLFSAFAVQAKKLTAAADAQSMNMFFGDGSAIPDNYIKHIEEVIWGNLSIFKWQKGDVLAIDNYSTSHGRLPFKGEREILVSWSA